MPHALDVIQHTNFTTGKLYFVLRRQCLKNALTARLLQMVEQVGTLECLCVLTVPDMRIDAVELEFLS
jgi:hypothetical protein